MNDSKKSPPPHPNPEPQVEIEITHGSYKCGSVLDPFTGHELSATLVNMGERVVVTRSEATRLVDSGVAKVVAAANTTA